MESMLALVQVLQQNDGDMSFPAFVVAARVAGHRPENWLKAKHLLMLETYFDDDGIHRIRIPVTQ